MKQLKLCMGLLSLSLFYSFASGQGLLVCVFGSSGSGKTTIVEKFIKQTSGMWQPLSMDDCVVRVSSSESPDQAAIKQVVKQTKILLDTGFPVICDLGFECKQDWDWFFKKFPDTKVVKVFVDCDLKTLIMRLNTRKERRTVDQVFNFFSKNFSLKNPDDRLSSIYGDDVILAWRHAAETLSEDNFKFLQAYMGRFSGIFNVAEGESHALGFEFGTYDLIVNNSEENAAESCAIQILRYLMNIK